MSSPSAPRDRPAEAVSPGSASFPKSRRLRNRAEFQCVYRDGARWTSPLFAAIFRQAETGEPGKTGLAVSRAIGNAVVRNRVKRRLREAVRRNLAALADGCEIVLQARRRIVDSDWPAIEADVRRAFEQATRVRARRRASAEAGAAARPGASARPGQRRQKR